MTKPRIYVYNKSVKDVYVVLGRIYTETQLQVGSPALNRSYPKEKEPFASDEMLPLMREHFLYKRGEGSVPGLKKKMEDYFKIVNYSMQYELESGIQLGFTFEKTAFWHLIGIHKLVDIPLIQKYNNPKETMVSAKYLLGKIKQRKLTEAELRGSKYFADIAERYERFTSENLLSMTYTDVVIDFDVTLLKASKLVNTKYILYEKEQNAYRQLCIKQNNKDQLYYVETFFYEKSDDYIKGQLHDKVRKMKVFAPDGSVYLEDTFE